MEWGMFINVEVGICLRVPATYREKHWAVTVGDYVGVTLRAGHFEELSFAVEDSKKGASLAYHKITRQPDYEGYSECTEMISGHETIVQSFRGGGFIFDDDRSYPPYAIAGVCNIMPGRILRFDGTASSRLEQEEQLAIIRTLEFMSPGPEPPPSSRANVDDNVETEVKSKLERAFKDKKFDAGSNLQTIRTSLRFSAPEDIRSKVVTTVTQEFKKIDDVSVVFDDFDYEVSVVASVASGGSSKPLYVISLVVAKSPAAVRANPKQYSALMGHTLETDEHLEYLCERVATETNAHVFEQERKARKMSPGVKPPPSPR
jgi:hypothetical protein